MNIYDYIMKSNIILTTIKINNAVSPSFVNQEFFFFFFFLRNIKKSTFYIFY